MVITAVQIYLPICKEFSSIIFYYYFELQSDLEIGFEIKRPQDSIYDTACRAVTIYEVYL